MKKLLIGILVTIFSVLIYTQDESSDPYNYEVCKTVSVSTLEKCGDKLLRNGFVPVGSITVYYDRGIARNYFIQSFIGQEIDPFYVE